MDEVYRKMFPYICSYFWVIKFTKKILILGDTHEEDDVEKDDTHHRKWGHPF